MRRELFLSFLFVIVCVASITSLTSSRTASDEFARLVASNTKQILNVIAFTAQEAIQTFPDWSAWQAALDRQYDEVQTFLEFPNQEDIVEQQIYLSTLDSSIDTILFIDGGDEGANSLADMSVPTDENINFTLAFFDETYIDNLVFDLLLDLEINNQQLVVIDQNNTVVVDSHRTYLNQPAPDLQEYSYAIILGENDEPIGRLYLILQNDIYSVQQRAFLDNMQRGNLFGAMAGTIVALLLAVIFAHQIIHPVRSLNRAMVMVSQGNWGHQVQNFGRHEIREIGQTFNQLSSNLLEQQKLRTRLVNDIAHEINTPLNLIRLEIESLVSGLQSPDDAQQYLNQEIDTLSNLLNDLIFLANERSSQTVKIVPININNLVVQTTQRFDVTSEQTMILKTPDSPIILESNPVLIERALSNLISNAIRYTPDDGEIIVSVDQRDTQVEICIRDTGIGIAQEHLSHIFERFYRVDEARQTATGGRGLGLSICKEIVQQLNGSIQVESVLGKGSTFKMILPFGQ